MIVWVVADATVGGSETGTSFRQALYFKECGFLLHDTMIYASKKPPMNHNRYEPEFEYMFVLSKGRPKTFNPLLEETKHGGKTMGKRTFRKGGKELQDFTGATQVKATKLRGNIWQYATGACASSKDKIAFQHPAIFPEQLAADHIATWSNPGDVVLDCFCGSGTTGKMALLAGRRFIGIDVSEEYIEQIARTRIAAALSGVSND